MFQIPLTCNTPLHPPLFSSKHITKQGSPNARFAIINLANHLRRKVPKYIVMYERIKNRKPPHQGHWVAVVAVARDLVTNVLYDILTNHRPFFVEVKAAASLFPLTSPLYLSLSRDSVGSSIIVPHN